MDPKNHMKIITLSICVFTAMRNTFVPTHPLGLPLQGGSCLMRCAPWCEGMHSFRRGRVMAASISSFVLIDNGPLITWQGKERWGVAEFPQNRAGAKTQSEPDPSAGVNQEGKPFQSMGAKGTGEGESVSFLLAAETAGNIQKQHFRGARFKSKTECLARCEFGTAERHHTGISEEAVPIFNCQKKRRDNLHNSKAAASTLCYQHLNSCRFFWTHLWDLFGF